MSKGTVPIVMCDHEDGCDQWVIDDWAMGVTAVNDVPVGPVPLGWSGKTGADEHLCPEHSPEVPF